MDIARSLHFLDLTHDGGIVDHRIVDVADDAQSDRIIGIFHCSQHRMQGRVALMGIVDQYIVQRITVLSDRDDLQFHVLENEPLFVLCTEKHLFAMTQRNGMLSACRLVGSERSMGLIIEDDAVL